MPNVPTAKNIILDDEMTKGLDFGPIPLRKPIFDLTCEDVTDEPQTVDVTQIVNVETASAPPATKVPVETKQVAAQKAAQKAAQSAQESEKKPAQKCATAEVSWHRSCHAPTQKTYMDVVVNMRDDELIPVVTSKVAPASHVPIAKLPLETLDMNSSVVDLTAEAVHLLPEDTYDETMAQTISDRKPITRRQKMVKEAERVRR